MPPRTRRQNPSTAEPASKSDTAMTTARTGTRKKNNEKNVELNNEVKNTAVEEAVETMVESKVSGRSRTRRQISRKEEASLPQPEEKPRTRGRTKKMDNNTVEETVTEEIIEEKKQPEPEPKPKRGRGRQVKKAEMSEQPQAQQENVSPHRSHLELVEELDFKCSPVRETKSATEPRLESLSPILPATNVHVDREFSDGWENDAQVLGEISFGVDDTDMIEQVVESKLPASIASQKEQSTKQKATQDKRKEKQQEDDEEDDPFGFAKAERILKAKAEQSEPLKHRAVAALQDTVKSTNSSKSRKRTATADISAASSLFSSSSLFSPKQDPASQDEENSDVSKLEADKLLEKFLGNDIGQSLPKRRRDKLDMDMDEEKDDEEEAVGKRGKGKGKGKKKQTAKTKKAPVKVKAEKRRREAMEESDDENVDENGRAAVKKEGTRTSVYGKKAKVTSTAAERQKADKWSGFVDEDYKKQMEERKRHFEEIDKYVLEEA